VFPDYLGESKISKKSTPRNLSRSTQNSKVIILDPPFFGTFFHPNSVPHRRMCHFRFQYAENWPEGIGSGPNFVVQLVPDSTGKMPVSPGKIAFGQEKSPETAQNSKFWPKMATTEIFFQSMRRRPFCLFFPISTLGSRIGKTGSRVAATPASTRKPKSERDIVAASSDLNYRGLVGPHAALRRPAAQFLGRGQQPAARPVLSSPVPLFMCLLRC